MQLISLLLGVMLVSAVSAAGQPGFLESIMLSIQQRPWLMGVYVFVVGLPLVLFVSFMWPDKTNRITTRKRMMSNQTTLRSPRGENRQKPKDRRSVNRAPQRKRQLTRDC
ncbi:calmegin-like isoform X2 [Gambusia affinis]|uniref:calmegin-like isoform X2 n=1 Tax=Gambusia affinis TaxID=33528 RepID=UPI001CDBF36A|nr:calmegin-like isoform X2 [Gambusia affinis]